VLNPALLIGDFALFLCWCIGIDVRLELGVTFLISAKGCSKVLQTESSCCRTYTPAANDLVVGFFEKDIFFSIPSYDGTISKMNFDEAVSVLMKELCEPFLLGC
jgi:hypothetical protein